MFIKDLMFSKTDFKSTELSALLGNGKKRNTITFSIITGTYHIAQQNLIRASTTLV